MFTERRARDGEGPFVIGLIGRTGSGKSTVARALASDGAEVIDADALGHEVTDLDPEVRAALVSEYGREVYRPDGTLDRARVASRVFTDASARARLNRLTHPRIVDRARARIAALRTRGFDGVVVLDAALLLDWGLERECHAVIAVEAREARQMEWLERARGWTPEQARQRLAVQRTNAELRAAADVTLENHGTPESLEIAAREAVRRLRARAPDGGGRNHHESC